MVKLIRIGDFDFFYSHFTPFRLDFYGTDEEFSITLYNLGRRSVVSKYEYPKDCVTKEQRKKYRRDMRAAAKKAEKPAKQEKSAKPAKEAKPAKSAEKAKKPAKKAKQEDED